MMRGLQKLRKYHAHLPQNLFWRVFQLLLKHGVSFYIFFSASHFLTPEEFGKWNYFLAFLSLFLLFCDFGISAAATKYSAEYGANQKKQRDTLLLSLCVVVMAITLGITAILFGISRFFAPELHLYFFHFVPYIFLIPLSSIFDGVYRGEKSFQTLAFSTLVAGIIAVGAATILIPRFFLAGVIWSQNILYLLLVTLLFCKRIPGMYWQFDASVVKKILAYGIVIGFSSIAYFLYNQADILILKEFGFLAEIGYYEILNKIFWILIFPFVILGQVFAPDITKIYAQKKYALVQKALISHLWIVTSAAVLITLVVYFVMPVIIATWLPKYFVPETEHMFFLLIWLLPIRMIAATVSQAHTLATGNAHYSLWTLSVAGVLNVVLDIVFIDQFGFLGVVYSTLMCYPLAIFSFLWLYARKLSVLSAHTKCS